MMTFAVGLAILAAGPSQADHCMDRCETNRSSCEAKCSDDHCLARCGDQAGSCITGCGGGAPKTASRPRPHSNWESPKYCGLTQAGTPRPCTEQETRQMQKAEQAMHGSKSPLGKCKDDAGRPMPCPEDREKMKKYFQKKNDPTVCFDDKGNPGVCKSAEAERSLEERARAARRDAANKGVQ